MALTVMQSANCDFSFSFFLQGTNVKKTFNDWSFKQCNSENLAREHLKKYSVEHYWDLALSQALIEETEV